MIFIGPYLFNKNSHFTSNIITSFSKKDIKEIFDVTIQNDNVIVNELNKLKNDIIVYNPYEKESFFKNVKKHKLFIFFSDDEWRWKNYDRYLALYADFFSITDESHLKYYKKWGFDNVIATTWAANPKNFYPMNVEKIYDVTFIGAAYGKRVEYIRELIKNNINFRVFGFGWDKYKDIKKYWGGYVSQKEMVRIINQSKINLNFLWSSRGNSFQIKGRSFEIPACKAFQLCNDTDRLYKYFTPNETIGVFRNKKDFIEKIKFYLDNNELREKIANKAYEEVINKHTWEKRFKEIFEFGKNKSKIKLPKFRILVLNGDKFTHNLDLNDNRFEIDFENKNKNYDGVIKLTCDTTLNNEALYMMAFGLKCDENDFIISNFYIDDLWIRFKDVVLENKKNLIKYLPIECFMFKDVDTLKRYRNNNVNDFDVSYIEYPTFEIKDLSRWKKRVLKMLFGEYKKREELKKSIKEKNFLKSLNILIDYFIQKKVVV